MVLKVHKSMLLAFQARLWADLGREDGTICHLRRSLDAEKFVLSDLEEGFGFGWLFKRGDFDREFATWRLFLPDAAGYRYGKFLARDVDLLENISANFTAALRPLFSAESDTPASRRQLLTVVTGTRRGQVSGHSIFGEVSVSLNRQLKELGRRQLPECTAAMLDAARFMNGHDFDPDDFPACLNDDGFVIDCPGNACGLNPAGSNFCRENEGYEFGCHNVDRPFQQLLLLVGLAALCDQMRRESKKPPS